MPESRPLKVLVSAFAFSPVRGSEHAVGWDFVQAIAARNKVWVVTRDLNQPEVEAFKAQHPERFQNISVHYVPLSHKDIRIPLREVIYAMRYASWQRKTYRLAQALDSEIQFDLIHQLNGIGFREPGYLWKLNRPFVWGPIGGMQYFPVRLLDALPLSGGLFFLFKNAATAASMYLALRPRRAAKAACALFAATSNVAEKIDAIWGRQAAVISEVSSPCVEDTQPARRDPDKPLQVLWCGTCGMAKALPIVLQALCRVKREGVDVQLTAVGDGPMRSTWIELARNLGLADQCHFVGKVTRSEVLELMRSAHCFVQPSLYDATSTVLAEALAYGLPVVCLDHFGFHDVVNESCGFRIPLRSLEQVTQGFAAALVRIGRDEELRLNMVLAARKAAQQLTVNRKQHILEDLYADVLVRDAEQNMQSHSPRS